MKKFELPEMNISMFDVESITMASGVTQAIESLDGANSIEVTEWATDWEITA